MTDAQRRAFDLPWQAFGVATDDDQVLDLSKLFGNDRPVHLEIGFGNGEALAEMAGAHPENNYLGIEVHRPGVGHLLLRLAELQLGNVRVIRQDAMDVLRYNLAVTSLDAVYLFFPDPWHKKRHHKRRIVRAELAEHLSRALKPRGIVHLATDWEHYARHIMNIMSAAHAFDNTAGPGQYTPRPPSRPLTRFEKRGRHLGHATWDLVFRRLAERKP